MDLASVCKDKLAYFRIKELKDVLTQLGLAKQGKKQDLVDRILGVLSDEQASKSQGWAKRHSIGKEAVAKIIDDTYRKMQNPGAPDVASTAHSGSDINNGKLKEEVDDSFQIDMKVRCPCGNTLPTESMIQCEDPRCRVWQHISCVMIPEKPMEAVPAVPPQFYCEICRITRADPFWVPVAHPLLPVKLSTSNIPTDGTNPVQNVDKTFQLTKAYRDLVQKNEYDVQAWCILLNDKVPFRMQWPQFADLQVNGVPIRTTNRPGSQLLGANGRDDGPQITTCTREGVNKILLSGCDARVFCLGVRIARRRTVQQVLNLIPKETEGETFEDALARVCRCVGGGNATDNADSDSDLEVVADSFTVNLRCPMSGSRMKTAGRFKPCAHMGCFDLDTFVELNQRSRKWQCPICLKNYSLENIIIDPYFNRITTMMRECGEDVTDIDVKPDGSWRAKNEFERRDLAQWHFPNGSLCVPTDRDVKPNLECLKQAKQEGGSEGHTGLKLGIKKNHNGIWQVSRPDNLQSLSSESPFEEKFVNHCQKVIPMSSSATGSYRDGEDPSVNQDGAGPFDFSANNGNELDSISLNFESGYGAANRVPSAPTVNADIIVLSDSEEENENLVSSDCVFGTGQADANGLQFSVPLSGVPDLYPEEPGVSTSGLFPNDEIGVPLWSSLTSGTQVGTGFQLFNTEADTIADVHHASTTCPTSLNGYTLGPDTIESTQQVSYSVCPSSSNGNGTLVDNPLAFGADDPALQIFLPSRPAGVSVQADAREQPELSNGLRSEDWISLRLGGGSGGGEPSGANGLNSTPHLPSKEGRMASLADTASLLLSMSDGRSEKTTPNKQSGLQLIDNSGSAHLPSGSDHLPSIGGSI
ncbi:E3 sumo-protein ligase siz1 [Thalictrum thalictroides]|uniref:E3 SUMO-protein ligase SIZ1 n=1 Tax=Thalictrum thalictroides TaxID=46969 RepID=A0A7J6VCU5_THATH|nr:E3 sumo-protein ligase siz1 [Thalictrum thalictroides]